MHWLRQEKAPGVENVASAEWSWLVDCEVVGDWRSQRLKRQILNGGARQRLHVQLVSRGRGCEGWNRSLRPMEGEEFWTTPMAWILSDLVRSTVGCWMLESCAIVQEVGRCV